MNKELLEALKILSTKLGTTAEHLWAVTIRQAKISALQDIILSISLIVLTIILYYIATKLIKKDRKHGDFIEYSPITIITIAIAVSVFVVTLIACFVSVADILTALLNPEYWALSNICALLKPTS